MDDLVFTDHARKALARDNISDEEAREVVRDYDERIDRHEDGRTEYGKLTIDGRWIVIVVEFDNRDVVSGRWDRRRGIGHRRRRRT